MARYQPRGPFLSVNAKQLAQPAFQVGPSRCKSDHGCQCPRSSVRLERHRAKVEVAGASPAVDAILPLCLSSHRTSFVNSYSSVRVRPEAPIYGDHDVTGASRPVKAFVPVRIRLVTPNFHGAPIFKSGVQNTLSQTSSRRAVTRLVLRIGWLTAAEHRTSTENRLW